MKKIYLTPKQLIIDIDSSEALLTGSDGVGLEDGDKVGGAVDPNTDDVNNQFSRQSGSAWDNEW